MQPIAVFAPEQHEPLIEGIQKSSYVTCQTLVKQGDQLVVFSHDSYGEEFKNPGYEVINAFATSGAKALKYISWYFGAWNIARQLRQKNVKKLIIFSLDWSFLFAAKLVTQRLPELPITICIFSMRELQGPGKHFITHHAKRSNVEFRCFSSYVATKLRDMGVEATRITSQPVFFTKPSQQTERTASNAYRVAYLSSADAAAGVATVVALAKAVPQVRVTLAIRKFSETEEARIKPALEALAAEKISNIRLERNITDMPKFLAATDAVILPPTNELSTMAVPLVALEAAYAGCSVYASALPVFAELEDMAIVKRFESDEHLIAQIKKVSGEPKQPHSDPTTRLMTVPDFASQIR